ncbi:MAG: hypothetical protein NWF04_08075 [Candidatus Bathyarchaeota archaeon]|nr:hypothetical protein [Candidatus Bathyarchaeota archaeon]
MAVDIFDMLSDSEEKAKEKKKESLKSQRKELLASTKVEDLFPEGSISINKYTCVGVQCKLCIKACPTNALYWTTDGVGITEDLCVHCGACVLSCMVDDCIKIKRKREETNEEEKFSTIHDVVLLADRINAKKRAQRVSSVFPSHEAYCDRYAPNNK